MAGTALAATLALLAARGEADKVASATFFTAQVDEQADRRTGVLVEIDRTEKIFSGPARQETEDYVTGKFG